MRGPLQILDCMQPRFGGCLLVLRAHLRAEHAHRFWMHYRSEVFEELAELTGRHVLQDPLREIHCGRVLCKPFFLRLGPIDECRFFSGESLGEFLGIELFECALGVLVLPTQQTCSFSCQPTSHPPWLNFTPHLPDQNSCFEGKEKPFWGHEDRGRRRIPSEEPRPFRHRQQDRRLGGLASSV